MSMNYLPWLAGGAVLGYAARRGHRTERAPDQLARELVLEWFALWKREGGYMGIRSDASIEDKARLTVALYDTATKQGWTHGFLPAPVNAYGKSVGLPVFYVDTPFGQVSVHVPRASESTEGWLFPDMIWQYSVYAQGPTHGIPTYGDVWDRSHKTPERVADLVVAGLLAWNPQAWTNARGNMTRSMKAYELIKRGVPTAKAQRQAHFEVHLEEHHSRLARALNSRERKKQKRRIQALEQQLEALEEKER
jgi:hypothetical protein|tara:strand:+ start:3086 stop:3835 length:750 start_codon:yes stop_codon:yes gene_type:complete